MSIESTGRSAWERSRRAKPQTTGLEPLGVSAKEAQRLLGVGRNYFYTKVAPELDDYYEGRAHRFTTASIKARQARLLAENKGQQPKRGPGRPKKAQPQQAEAVT